MQKFTMVRIFTAIELPVELKETLLNLRTAVHSAKWSDIEDIHLTLRFIGEVSQTDFIKIRDALTAVQHKPFSLKPKSTGAFGSADTTKVLWAGFQLSEELKMLEKKISRVLLPFSIEDAARKFVPHATLARLNHPKADEISNWLSSTALFEAESFEVSSFKLYSSHLKAQPKYLEEAEYFLEQSV